MKQARRYPNPKARTSNVVSTSPAGGCVPYRTTSRRRQLTRGTRPATLRMPPDCLR